MSEADDEKAYIRIEREATCYKYIAKVSGELPRQITKRQYTTIVKALKAQDWKNNDDNEARVISRIIKANLPFDES